MITRGLSFGPSTTTALSLLVLLILATADPISAQIRRRTATTSGDNKDGREDLGGTKQTGTFEESLVKGTEYLESELESHPDVNYFFNPKNQYKNNDIYRTSIPLSQEYAIGILVNPCGSNATTASSSVNADTNSTVGTTDVVSVLGYDCCNNVFGDGEYGILTDAAVKSYKRTPPSWMKDIPVFEAATDEISSNMNRIDGRGKLLPARNSRAADDEVIIDESCIAKNDPKSYCAGPRTRQKKFTAVARCTDNNQTVDALRMCYDIAGNAMKNCMQVSTTQSAFVHVCGGDFQDDDHCGTFLEVHRSLGSPYDPEEKILAQSKLVNRFTSGMYTSTMNLTYDGDPTRVLCKYSNDVIAVGLSVTVNNKGAVCCCPKDYKSVTRLGMYQCPRKTGTDHGPFASSNDNLMELLSLDTLMLQYPFCPTMEEKEDKLMCSRLSTSGFTQYSRNVATGIREESRRAYATECDTVEKQFLPTTPGTPPEWVMKSADLFADGYENAEECRFWKSCVDAKGVDCKDQSKSFIGRKGVVTYVPENWKADQNALFKVSFNGGRTDYEFIRAELDLVPETFNYELWYVQRTNSEFIIQQRKPFKVNSPRCSFDTVNDRYFPYAKLDANGLPLTNYDGGFDGEITKIDYSENQEVFYDEPGQKRRLHAIREQSLQKQQH